MQYPYDARVNSLIEAGYHVGMGVNLCSFREEEDCGGDGEECKKMEKERFQGYQGRG